MGSRARAWHAGRPAKASRPLQHLQIPDPGPTAAESPNTSPGCAQVSGKGRAKGAHAPAAPGAHGTAAEPAAGTHDLFTGQSPTSANTATPATRSKLDMTFPGLIPATQGGN
jgi:hypothetical protein